MSTLLASLGFPFVIYLMPILFSILFVTVFITAIIRAIRHHRKISSSIEDVFENNLSMIREDLTNRRESNTTKIVTCPYCKSTASATDKKCSSCGAPLNK